MLNRGNGFMLKRFLSKVVMFCAPIYPVFFTYFVAQIVKHDSSVIDSIWYLAVAVLTMALLVLCINNAKDYCDRAPQTFTRHNKIYQVDMWLSWVFYSLPFWSDDRLVYIICMLAVVFYQRYMNPLIPLFTGLRYYCIDCSLCGLPSIIFLAKKGFGKTNIHFAKVSNEFFVETEV